MVKDGTLTGFSIDASNVQFREDKVIETLEDFIEFLNKTKKS